MTEPQTQHLTAQLLIDLVNDTLDPGYAAAAQRRGPGATRRWYDRPAVFIGFLLVGFLIVVAYIHTHRGAPQAAKVHDRLVNRVRAEQHEDTTLAAKAQSLTAQLARLRVQAGVGSLADQLARQELLAGQIAVHGPGLEVVLKEAPSAKSPVTPGRGGSDPITSSHILTDRDVRSVVNELWADGAEAISVNDVRLTATSAIRFAGEAVLVDFQPITAPYKIRAVGNADDLATGFAASSVASRYQTLSSAEGIGFAFTEHSTMSLPASAVVAPRYAVPITPSPTGSSR